MGANWYRAVCDEHKEMCVFFCSDPITSAGQLGDKAETILIWFSLHYGCKLRMVHLDQMITNELWDNYMDAYDPMPGTPGGPPVR